MDDWVNRSSRLIGSQNSLHSTMVSVPRPSALNTLKTTAIPRGLRKATTILYLQRKRPETQSSKRTRTSAPPPHITLGKHSKGAKGRIWQNNLRNGLGLVRFPIPSHASIYDSTTHPQTHSDRLTPTGNPIDKVHLALGRHRQPNRTVGVTWNYRLVGKISPKHTHVSRGLRLVTEVGLVALVALRCISRSFVLGLRVPNRPPLFPSPFPRHTYTSPVH